MVMSQNIEVDNLVTVASPGFGEFGFPTWLGIRRYVVDYLRENAHKFIYNFIVQKTIGMSWIWRDPIRKQEYLTKNLVLPLINNEIQHTNSEKFKRNFLKLKKYVIFGSDGDDIVDPWQSQFYGFFNETMHMIPMEEQEIFKKDSFGLLTLHRTNRLVVHFEKSVAHLAWLARDDLIEKIIKYLD
jgi:palmitoyl-protein thioesterase